MDDFKKAGVVVLTANDLNAKCVCVKNKTRRRLMRIARKMGRHKLKEEVTMQVEEYPNDLSDIFPWIEPGKYIRVKPNPSKSTGLNGHKTIPVESALRNQPAEKGV